MAKVRSRKQDIAWQYLFDRFDIPNQIEKYGGFEITSSDINKYVREYYANRPDNAPDARNLLKFDFSSDLPEVFKESVNKEVFGKKAQFSLMPKGKDRYEISDFKTFENLKYEVLEPVRMTFPKWISGIRPESPETINSEAVAQSVAEMSGMLKYVMNDLDADVVATLSGKKGTGLIDFQISHFRDGQTKFVIDGWQSEIDGVYESPSRVLIIESKKKRPEDFNIRQLYIPTRIYHDQMKFPKEIYSAYFTYTDDVFSFHVYQFTDINDFNSLKKIREYEFVFEEESKPVTRDTLKMLLAQEPNSMEPRREDGELVPFIQANDPEKIFEIPVVLSGQKSGRPAYEVYLPVPRELHKKVNGWFGTDTLSGDGTSVQFTLHFPDGQEIPGRLTQQGYKSFQTNPQQALGEWLIKNVLNVEKGTVLTKALLDERGVDCVRLWHDDPEDTENIWIDFATSGTFERFMSID